MRKTLLLALLFAVSLPLLAQQTIVDHLRVTSYLSFDDAQAASLYTSNVRTITPVRMTWTDANAVPYELVTWLVISQPTVYDPPDDQIAVVNTLAPPAWTGTTFCGSGLRAITATWFADWTAANTWLNDGHIAPIQRRTLSLREMTGAQFPGIKVNLEYQIIQAFCTDH